MRLAILLFQISLLASPVHSQEVMTVAKFKELSSALGDSKPLRKELAVEPYWTKSKVSNTMKYSDGRVFNEDLDISRKSIAGEYIVETFYSNYYKRKMYSIVGFDDRASCIRQWSLFGNTLVTATIIHDEKKHVSAVTSSYADGMLELGVSTFTDGEISSRSEVFKDGVRVMVREGMEKQATKSGNAEQGAPPPTAGATHSK